MKQEYNFPSNYLELLETIPEVAKKKPVFTHGDTIYNPYRLHLDEHIIAHEQVHQAQQIAFVGGAEAWWDKYLSDPAFRLQQELEAYRVQQLSFRFKCRDREQLHNYAWRLATSLCGGLYGKMLRTIEAYKQIREIEQ